tara:strand:+ start:907 stop:2811 length:1905 start_codon:yes stop_codon:yes gene_type:complete
MNNPLNRKMFRQAGMSKQPMGILASSPELMTTAQKAMMSGQPVTAQVGTSVNTKATTGFGLNQSPSVPSGVGNFIKNAFTTDSPSALGQVINYGLKGLSAKKDSDADKDAEEANENAKNKIVKAYSQAGIGDATGSELGYSAKEAPSSWDDTNQAIKSYFNKTSSGIIKNIESSGLASGGEDLTSGGVDLDKKGAWENLKIIAKNATVGLVESAISGSKYIKDKTKETRNQMSLERALSAEDTGGLRNKNNAVTADYQKLLQREEDARNAQFGFRKSIFGVEYGDREKVVLQPGETGGPKEEETKEITKVLKPQENAIDKNITKNITKNKAEVPPQESFTEVQNKILEFDRASEEGYTSDGGRTKIGEEQAVLRDMLYGVTTDSLNSKEAKGTSPVSENNMTFKSELGKVLGINTDDMPLKNRHAMYKKMLEGITGKSPGNLKSDANFNLIMTGLLIASGESPNALTNIAKGAAQGLKMYGDSLAEDNKEKKSIELAAFKLAVTANEAQKERDVKLDIARLDRINKKTIASLKATNTYQEYYTDISKKLLADPKEPLGPKRYIEYSNLQASNKTEEAADMLNSAIKDFVDKSWSASGGTLPTSSDNSAHVEPNRIAKEQGKKSYFIGNDEFQTQ